MFGDPAENPRDFRRTQVESLFSETEEGVKCGPFGTALKKHEYVASGIPVWTMNNVYANEFTEEGCLYITPKKFEELAAYSVKNGDILVSRAGTVGRMAVVHTRHTRSILHTNIIRLSLDQSKILPVYFVVLMTWFAPRIARLKRGQEEAYTFMSTGSLGELRIPLPPFALQQEFAALVERLEHLRAVQRESLRQAEHLFASLLERAFRIDVAAAAIADSSLTAASNSN
jgi:type I restriction enzyme S subunit